VAAVPESVVDDLFAIGTAPEGAAHVHRYVHSGVDVPVLAFMPLDPSRDEFSDALAGASRYAALTTASNGLPGLRSRRPATAGAARTPSARHRDAPRRSPRRGTGRSGRARVAEPGSPVGRSERRGASRTAPTRHRRPPRTATRRHRRRADRPL